MVYQQTFKSSKGPRQEANITSRPAYTLTYTYALVWLRHNSAQRAHPHSNSCTYACLSIIESSLLSSSKNLHFEYAVLLCYTIYFVQHTINLLYEAAFVLSTQNANMGKKNLISNRKKNILLDKLKFKLIWRTWLYKIFSVGFSLYTLILFDDYEGTLQPIHIYTYTIFM